MVYVCEGYVFFVEHSRKCSSVDFLIGGGTGKLMDIITRGGSGEAGGIVHETDMI